jgi:hypothetical protein
MADQMTTATVYYASPAIHIYVPRSTATYRRVYYATTSEYPVDSVTVYRAPAVNVLPNRPLPLPVPAGLLAPLPVPPPPGLALGLTPTGVVELGPPMVPGQPLRNAFRAMMW